MMRAFVLWCFMCAIVGCEGAGDSPAQSFGISYLNIYQQEIPAFGGRLLGSDHGEWGGRLSFQDEDGRLVRLLDKNVVGIHRMPFGYVVVTGLWHMSIDEGELFLVTLQGGDKIRVDRLMVLPHAAVKSWQQKDDSLDIALFTGEFDGEGHEAKPKFECLNYSLDRTMKPVACPPCTHGNFCWQ